MKKILFSMAAAALLLNVTGCQNEAIVLQQQEEATGQNFTLQATYGKGTRTTLESNGTGYATKWSAGDQILVTDGNGLVTGVLTLTEGEGESTGSFSGIVTGNPAALKYAIFPVPADGVIDLRKVDASQADAPMTAEISGNQANFQNACGLVRLAIYNLPDNAKVTLSAKGIAGTLVADGGNLVQGESADDITIMNAKSGQFFVPVAAGDNTAEKEFTLTVNGTSTTFKANIQKGAVSQKGIPELYVSGNSLVNLGDIPAGSDVTVTVIPETATDPDASFEDAVTATDKEIIVKLDADVTYEVAAWANDAMGGEKTEKITIIGNGHTITFNQTNSDWNNIVTNGAVLAIHNAHITNSGHNNGPWNRHDLNFACDVELTNVTSDKAIALKAGGTLTNVTINDANTSDTYALWIQPNGQTVTLDGCVIDMIDCSDGRGIKIDEQYVGSPEKVTLNVSNTVFKTEEKSAILVKSVAGAAINLSNVDITEVAADNTNPVWVDEASAAYADLVVVTGGTKIVEP